MKVFIKLLRIASILFTVRADELNFVTVLYRHGHRSPISVYSTDPYPASIWKNGLGQLTNLGKVQAYKLGKYIRERYSEFLPVNYHEEDIRVMSSDISRTLMTAYCVLAGLYGPQGDDIWLDTINWQPIPVHSVPTSIDNLMYNNVSCPKHQQLLNDNVYIAKSETINKYAEIVEEIIRTTRVPMPNKPLEILRQGVGFYDCLSIEETYGLELPEWTKKFYPKPLSEIAKFGYAMSTSDDQLKRLSCGPLLKDIIQHMEDIRQGKSKIKMWQYSAHDTTILGILQCMGVYDGELIRFASAVFIELYKTEKDFEVAIAYKRNEEVKDLAISGCKPRCPLNRFKDLLNHVIPENWEEECKT